MPQDTKSHQLHWDNKYSKGNTHAEYQPDPDLINLIDQFPTSGLALDVACGTGRNSFFIAQHGLDVVCMDFSNEGLNYLKQHRNEEPVAKKLFPIQVDLTDISLPKSKYDAIFVIRYLDRNAFQTYLDALKPKGLLFFKAFNVNHLKSKPNFNPEYLLDKEELIYAFRDQEVIMSNDSVTNTDEESIILVKNTKAS